MPTANGATAPASTPSPAQVSFIDGTYEYTEIIGSYSVTLGAAAVDLPPIPITPGGFLRGVTLTVTSTGGSLGTGVVSPDGPFTVFNSIALETVDGTPILYPMSGYNYALAQALTRPWDENPFLDPDNTNTIAPAFQMRLFNESRATLGVLPNTDARSQYRLRLSINSLAGYLSSVGTATAPTVTVTVALETYAQPPATTLTGQPIAQIPDGISVQRFLSHQIIGGLNTTDNTLQVTRTGNLIRSHMLVFRNSSGVRTDLTSDPVRLRVDNTQLWVQQRSRWRFNNQQFLASFGTQGLTSQNAAYMTGVYFLPRFQNVGAMLGQSWLGTTPATFLQYEVLGAAANGTCDVITEDLAPKSSMIPPYLANS